MNQRIKELMIEAGYAAPEIAERGKTLAKLIAEECVAECQRIESQMRRAERDSNTVEFARGPKNTRQRVAAACAAAIKKKFDLH